VDDKRGGAGKGGASGRSGADDKRGGAPGRGGGKAKARKDAVKPGGVRSRQGRNNPR
jgi:hypothetical protein